MTRITVFSILFLAFSGIVNAAALRVLEQPEDAYELKLGEVSLPDRSGGSVIFKACDDCRTTALRVTNTTTYEVDGQAVDLAAFKKRPRPSAVAAAVP